MANRFSNIARDIFRQLRFEGLEARQLFASLQGEDELLHSHGYASWNEVPDTNLDGFVSPIDLLLRQPTTISSESKVSNSRAATIQFEWELTDAGGQPIDNVRVNDRFWLRLFASSQDALISDGLLAASFSFDQREIQPIGEAQSDVGIQLSKPTQAASGSSISEYRVSLSPDLRTGRRVSLFHQEFQATAEGTWWLSASGEARATSSPFQSGNVATVQSTTLSVPVLPTSTNNFNNGQSSGWQTTNPISVPVTSLVSSNTPAEPTSSLVVVVPDTKDTSMESGPNANVTIDPASESETTSSLNRESSLSSELTEILVEPDIVEIVSVPTASLLIAVLSEATTTKLESSVWDAIKQPQGMSIEAEVDLRELVESIALDSRAGSKESNDGRAVEASTKRASDLGTEPTRDKADSVLNRLYRKRTDTTAASRQAKQSIQIADRLLASFGRLDHRRTSALPQTDWTLRHKRQPLEHWSHAGDMKKVFAFSALNLPEESEQQHSFGNTDSKKDRIEHFASQPGRMPLSTMASNWFIPRMERTSQENSVLVNTSRDENSATSVTKDEIAESELSNASTLRQATLAAVLGLWLWSKPRVDALRRTFLVSAVRTHPRG